MRLPTGVISAALVATLATSPVLAKGHLQRCSHFRTDGHGKRHKAPCKHVHPVHKPHPVATESSSQPERVLGSSDGHGK